MILMKVLKKTVYLFLFIFMFVNAWANDDKGVRDFNQTYKKYAVLAGKNEWEKALPYAHKVYLLGEKVYGTENKNVAALAYNYGLTLKHVGKNNEAKNVIKQALGLYEGVYGKDAHELIPVLMSLGTVKAKTFDPSLQLRYYKRALRISRKHYGEQSVDHGQLLVDVGLGVLHKSQSRDANRYLKKGHEILLAVSGPDDLRTGMAAFYMGKYYIAIYQYEKAKKYLLQAMPTFQIPDKPSNRMELMTHSLLTESYEGLGERDLATKHCQAIGKMTPFKSKQHYFPLVKRSPKYPLSAARRGAEGFVIVEFDVDESGFVRDPKVVKREGMASFETAALKAVDKFRYAPAFKNGEPVLTKGIKNKVTFEMTDL